MLTGKIGVTTARNATGGTAAAQARAWAEQLGAIYVERPHNMGVDELMAQHELAALVVGLLHTRRHDKTPAYLRARTAAADTVPLSV